jgi:glyceraldehyde 3-phosphate dehydrogenase (phosphorylating)
MVRIAINGFGRIGRNFLRALLADTKACDTITVVAINIGPARSDLLAYMFKYDTLMGAYPGTVTFSDNILTIDNHRIIILAQTDIAQLPWREHALDWVVECSGAATTREKALQHCTAGAGKVLISASAHGDDVSIVLGVNEEQFNAEKHKIVSLGSCTTNAMIPTFKVLHDAFIITHGFMTTTHAYTNSQVLLDVESKTARLSRAAALNIIPTTTGASLSLDKVLPELKGKVACSSVRVPVAKVSLIDCVVLTQKKMSLEAIHEAFKAASENRMQGILTSTDEPLVSSDFSGNPHSVIIDTSLTTVNGPLAKVCGWYDNEWAYSVRLKDFLMRVA